MAYYDLAFIRAQIKNFVSIQDVFNKYCYGTKQVQGRYKCPFNPKEDRYNFMIKGRSWRCFSCGCSGDEISLVQKLFDLNTKDAMIKIATDFRLALEVNDKDAERIKKEESRGCFQPRLSTLKHLIEQVISCGTYPKKSFFVRLCPKSTPYR